MLTQEQVHNFAAELARSLAFAANDCMNRAFTPNVFGTTQISPTAVSLNLRMSGSQNILDWGCLANGWIASGNPTVSLAGQMSATLAGFSYSMTHSGQIIYGPRGGGQRSCVVNFETLANQASGNTARIRGSICDTSFDRDIVVTQ